MQLPDDAIITKVKITNKAPSYESTAFNGVQNIRSTGSQWFEIDLSITADNDGIRAMDAFIALLNGRENSFALTIPGRFSSSNGRTVGNITTNQINAGASTVTLRSQSTRSRLAIGDYIKFGNHSKLYMVTGSASRESISITPKLRHELPEGTAIEHKDVEINVRLTKDDITTKYHSIGNVAEYSLKTREAL